MNTFNRTLLSRMLLSSALILLAIGSAPAQSARAQEIGALMQRAYRLGIFNGNVLVVEKGKTVYRSSFGYTNGGRKTMLTADYRFNIGSIAKEFNAVGIMMLKERGKLRLDDKVSDLLDGLPAWAEKITVKNLLQYTSGLPDINWRTVNGDADVFNYLKTIKELNFEPGTNYAYNNSNTFLQRRIIEKLAGVSFQKFVETRMLRPCKMSASVVDPDLKGKNFAVAFNNDFVEDARQFTLPMSGWTSVTAADLYKWSECLHGYKLIDKVSLGEILKPFAPGKQSGLGGGEMTADGVLRQHAHHGSSFDFEALMFTEPADELAIVLLTNNKNFKLFEIKDAVRAILKGAPYKMPKRSIRPLLMKKIDEPGVEEIIKLYNETKAKQPDDFDFDDEQIFNQIGYSLMSKKRLDDAIKIFELNAALFPESANVYDSLGEAYLGKGDKTNALVNYKKSLKINPNNAAAKKAIDEIEK